MTIDIQAGASDVAETIRSCILEALPGAEVEVASRGPGHFEIRVVSEVFEGLNRVKQQQRVYAAISHLMSGANAPVHAVDRMECLTRPPQ